MSLNTTDKRIVGIVPKSYEGSGLLVPNHVATQEEEMRRIEEQAMRAQQERDKAYAEIQKEMEEKDHQERDFNKRLAESPLAISKKLDLKRQYFVDERESMSSLVPLNEAWQMIEAVEKCLGFEIPNTCGWFLTIKLFVDDYSDGFARDAEGRKTGILLDDAYRKKLEYDAKFRSICGLVVSMGYDCYKDEKFDRTGPWCRIGDIVTFKLHNATQFMYRGYAFAELPDNKVMQVIQSPDFVKVTGV